jgi:hypothetical protein
MTDAEKLGLAPDEWTALEQCLGLQSSTKVARQSGTPLSPLPAAYPCRAKGPKHETLHCRPRT